MTNQINLEYILLDFFYNEIISQSDPWLRVPFKEIMKLKPFNKNHPNVMKLIIYFNKSLWKAKYLLI